MSSAQAITAGLCAKATAINSAGIVGMHSRIVREAIEPEVSDVSTSALESVTDLLGIIADVIRHSMG